VDIDQRAARAKQLQDDPIFREVMDGLRDAAVAAWTQTKVDEAGQREFSWLMVKSIMRIEAHLQGIVDDQHISAQASVRAPQ
jgi:hypothetical protein